MYTYCTVCVCVPFFSSTALYNHCTLYCTFLSLQKLIICFTMQFVLSSLKYLCSVMFTVVEFRDSAEVEVVPINWLQNEGKTCLWPSISGLGASTKVTKAIQNRLEPSEGWESFAVRRIMCKTGRPYMYSI